MDETLRRYLADEIPGHLALMQLFIASGTEADAREKLLSAVNTDNSEGAARLLELKALWDRTPDAYPLVSQIHQLANLERSESGHSRLPDFREVFDRAAGISAEAGVALYSLGNRELLQRITAEVVVLMDGLGLFNIDSVVAEIGCGAGRFLEAIAPRVRWMIGLDISQQMLRRAQQQLHGLNNVLLVQIPGTGLSMLRESSFDLLLAIDSFPYIVHAGVEEDYFRDCARVLAPGGQLLVMNFAYDGGLEKQRGNIGRLSEDYGFTLLRNGTRDLRSWDGTSFLLRKPAT